MFPRIKQFSFKYKTSMLVPAEYVGRLDLIALKEYGDIRYYKPIAAANGIKNPIGTRLGIRIHKEAIAKDLIETNNVNSTVDDVVDKHISSINDWNAYGDFSTGYVTDVYEGRLLNLPTEQSAITWLNQYEKVSK